MALESFQLDGDVAIVTGGGVGLGRAIALGLAEAGADVVVAGRRKAPLESVRKEVEALGRAGLTVPTDVSSPADQDTLVQAVMDRFGHIDILVNNAGVTHRAPAVDFPDEEWQRVIDVNLTAVFQLCRRVGRIMVEQHKGNIINIASLCAALGFKRIAAYNASKGGVALLTKSLAVEWAEHNIRVNAICPGYFRTDMTEGLEDDPERGPLIRSRLVMKRWGEPDDLRGTAVYLASKASSYVTGQCIYVDGGWTAG
jgi:NAD(P)-dependent dehydrogenase (short-subunit alcohol dehydrogenase family)